MKKKFFINRNNAPEAEDAFIEIPVKTKYILCFPPGEMPAGNFFSRVKKVICWKPCEKNRYEYEAASVGKREESGKTGERIRTGDMVCVFMKNVPGTGRGAFLTGRWMEWKIKKYMQRIEREKPDTVCDVYRMKHRQDYPYSLRLHFAENFLENLDFGRKTRIGIVEGNMLGRQDLIALLRGCYDKMNFLTIFARDGEFYRELVEDAWEQYGLAITVTPSFGELTLCNYVLDCTAMPFDGSIRCGKGCFFFSLLGDQKKIRSLRKAGGEITFDSCANVLDRAFHNKV